MAPRSKCSNTKNKTQTISTTPNTEALETLDLGTFDPQGIGSFSPSWFWNGDAEILALVAEAAVAPAEPVVGLHSLEPEAAWGGAHVQGTKYPNKLEYVPAPTQLPLRYPRDHEALDRGASCNYTQLLPHRESQL